jgi:phosphinothricin acetyltransferase
VTGEIVMTAAAAEVMLRPAHAGDLAAITSIYAHHVRTGTASFELEPPDAQEMEHRWRDVVERGLPYWVAERAGEAVGYAYASPYRPRAAYRYTLEDSVYVREDCIGAGIGRKLLDLLVAECARFGARQLIAVIGDSANAASIRLHAAAGFTHLGTLDKVGWKFGRWLDVVLMQRALGSGSATSPDERARER